MTDAVAAWADVTVADIALIQRILPHRYPFLMIDRVEEISAGRSAVGIKCVTVTEPHFQGHFPGVPIMPGVLIVEAMAQTAAVLVGLTLNLVDTNPLVYFMAIDEAKFRRKVGPGDVLRLQVTVERQRRDVWKFAGRAMVGDELAAEAGFTAMIDRRGG
jgi:3-hydroxyacyl-[acyl-carrier-protein] dehydratase